MTSCTGRGIFMHMKQTLTLILACVVLAGCESAQERKQRIKQFRQQSASPVVVKIEGCEYFAIHTYNSEEDVLTHKGNCSNPIHVTTLHTVKK